jgi:hypothetical protein
MIFREEGGESIDFGIPTDEAINVEIREVVVLCPIILEENLDVVPSGGDGAEADVDELVEIAGPPLTVPELVHPIQPEVGTVICSRVTDEEEVAR